MGVGFGRLDGRGGVGDKLGKVVWDYWVVYLLGRGWIRF